MRMSKKANEESDGVGWGLEGELDLWQENKEQNPRISG